jgi:steroid 5-alpha reductase family enzyme
MLNSIYFHLFLLVLLYFSLFFVIAVLKKDNSIVDIGWGLGYVYTANMALYLTNNYNLRSFIITFIVTIWGLRLSYHIFKRNMGKGEDFRYAEWRKNWDNFYLTSFLRVFMLQGVLLFIISTPIIKIISSPYQGLKIIDFIGLLLWGIGFAFETAADKQLQEFKSLSESEKDGHVLKSGVWKYTRHPNYFGDALVWWGFYTIALAVSGGLIFVFSPLIMTFLLRFVSGVPLLEKHYADNEEYQKYAEKTNIFFPWFPKK